MKKSQKIMPISILLAALLITTVFYICNRDELITTSEKDVYPNPTDDSVFSRGIIHQFKSGHSAENSVLITKTPMGNSSCNIVITFNNHGDHDLYKISDLEFSIRPKDGVTLDSVSCDSGTDSQNFFEFQDNTFTANSDDYLHLNITVSDYYSDGIVCDLKYNINGRFTHPIKEKCGFGTSISV